MKLEALPLHLLPTFIIAAQLQNLRATARQVHLTHGAVSQQIQQLEQALGLPLFSRHGRGIQLNAAGEALLALVEPTLRTFERGVEQIKQMAAREVLHLSILPSFAHYWLIPRLNLFREQYPSITLDIEASLTVHELHKQGFDAAIRLGKGHWPDLQSHLIALGDVIPVASSALAARFIHLWQMGSSKVEKESSALLKEIPLLEHRYSPWQSWFHYHQQQPYGTQIALFNDAGLMLQAVEQGEGIGLIRMLYVQQLLVDGKLTKLDNAANIDGHAFYLVTPQYQHMNDKVRILLSWLQQQMTKNQAIINHI